MKQQLAKNPFSNQVKARELNVVGKLDFQRSRQQGLAGIAVNSKGVLAVADMNSHCILVFDETGSLEGKETVLDRVMCRVAYVLTNITLSYERIIAFNS